MRSFVFVNGNARHNNCLEAHFNFLESLKKGVFIILIFFYEQQSHLTTRIPRQAESRRKKSIPYRKQTLCVIVSTSTTVISSLQQLQIGFIIILNNTVHSRCQVDTPHEKSL